MAALPPPVACTIAGSDPSGGAGIPAGPKALPAFGAYGPAVITSRPGENTPRVGGRVDLAPDIVVAQLAAVQDDLDVAAAKTGMLATAAQVAALAAHLGARPLPFLVVDPVLVATSGDALADDDVAQALRTQLLPL